MGDMEEWSNTLDRPERVVCLNGNFIDRETRQNGGAGTTMSATRWTPPTDTGWFTPRNRV